MNDRIEAELELLRQRYPDLIFEEIGLWVCIPAYPVPVEWSAASIDTCFQIPDAYPGAAPYGIYVPSGFRYSTGVPSNYTEPAATQPPFTGEWGVFSWMPEDGAWKPSAIVSEGSNLLNWVIGFNDRFRGGK